jgi:hypothetical protein
MWGNVITNVYWFLTKSASELGDAGYRNMIQGP